MYSIAAPLLFLIGLSGIVLVLARAFPLLWRIPEPEGAKNFQIANKIQALIQRIPWQKWFFHGIELLLTRVRKVLFIGLKKSERLTHKVQVRSGKLSPENGMDALPKFFNRIRKRKAFLEEERKLLEYLAHNNDDAAAYKRLGNLYAIAGNIKDARAALEQSLRLMPDDEEIMQRLEELS